MTDQPQNQVPAFLSTDRLIFQQTRNFMGNDFQIQDEAGNVLAHLETKGSAVSRMMMGNRSFVLFDDRGVAHLQLEDVVNFIGDTFELYYPNGAPLATIRKRFTLFSQHMQIELPDLTLDLKGAILDYDFQILSGDHLAATVAREWGGFGKALMGHSKYGVTFDPQAPPLVRLAMIGGLVALDLSREKQKG